MTQQILTQAQLKEVLHYCPDTGVFTWKRRAGRIASGVVAGCQSNNGHGNVYILISVLGKRYSAHRLAFLYMRGELPKFEVDHADGNGLNNKWGNLTDVVRSKNAKNMKLSAANSSGCTGVYWHSGCGKWGAEIKVNGKKIRLGFHGSIFEAACKRKSADIKYGFHKNHGTLRVE